MNQKRTIAIVFLLSIYFIFSFVLTISCTKSPAQPDNSISDTIYIVGQDTFCLDKTPRETIEERVRDDFSISRKKFRWAKYDSLLQILDNPRYKVLPMVEFKDTPADSSCVIVALRHDIDYDPMAALDMAQMEHQYGFRASYYILQTALYFGDLSSYKISIFKEMFYYWDSLSALGHEICDHNDLIALDVRFGISPPSWTGWWHGYLSRRGSTIYGACAHGGYEARTYGYADYEIFVGMTTRPSVFVIDTLYPLGLYTLEDLGYVYEGYHIYLDKYFSDSGGSWSETTGDPVYNLESVGLGKKVIILAHPDWWGKP